MNNLCTEIGYQSLYKHGEQLCGDHIDIIDQEDGTKIIVLADGLGSGAQKNDSFSDFKLELILQGGGSCCFVKILHKSGFGHTCDGAEFCDRNFLIVVSIKIRDNIGGAEIIIFSFRSV